jgi:hypothetical protein
VNTKSIGERSEAIVMAEFLKAGYVVLMPFGDNQRYDLVIDIDGKFLRVQCKTARLIKAGAVLNFPAYSSSVHRSGGTKKGYRDQADLFAVYSPDTGQVYILPVAEVGESDVALRLTPPRHRYPSVRYADNYLLSKWQQHHGAVAQSGERQPVKLEAAGSKPVIAAEVA